MKNHIHESNQTIINHDHTSHSLSQHHMHMPDNSGMVHMDMSDMKKRFWWSLGLMIPIIIMTPFMGMRLPFTLTFPYSIWIVTLLSVILYTIGTTPFFTGAKQELKSKKPAMMTLVSMGLLVTFWYSIYTVVTNQIWHTNHVDFFWEFATLTVIMLLGHRIEMSATMQAGNATAALQSLLPNIVHVQHGHHVMDMSITELKVGMTIQVLVGEAFPADGIVVDGRSQVDESLVTGESQLVEKYESCRVVSGTINGGSTLTIQVTDTGEQAFIGQLQTSLNHSQDVKSRVETLANRVASYLFWFAFITAIISLAIWTPLHGFAFALNIAITVLVIACPHALGLAVPLVIQRTKSIGAAQGILINNRQVIGVSPHLKFALMDKTGTLTTGKFNVINFISFIGSDEENLSLMASLNRQSTHPLAESIIAYANENNATQLTTHSFTNLPGYGVSGVINQLPYALVSERYLIDYDINFEPLNSEGTNSYLISQNMVLAAITQGDQLKPSAIEFISDLKSHDIIPIMVTGDNKRVATKVANQLGIQKVHAEVSPQNKIELVQFYQAHGPVIMIGDGINDAPALAQADLSIAIGTGTKVAQASADTILITNNLLKIIAFLSLIQQANIKQKENLLWGAGYNIFAIPLAAGILFTYGFVLNPMIGAVVMSLSTIIVALNALTIKNKS